MASNSAENLHENVTVYMSLSYLQDLIFISRYKLDKASLKTYLFLNEFLTFLI